MATSRREVGDRHRSVEFIGLLSDLDAKYPPEGDDQNHTGQSFRSHL